MPQDGERETRVEERLIRKKDGGGGGSDSFREGDKIEADYRGRGKFYPGKISRDRGDDSYDIDYDDGSASRAGLVSRRRLTPSRAGFVRCSMKRAAKWPIHEFSVFVSPHGRSRLQPWRRGDSAP